jgi:hypothetical protein
MRTPASSSAVVELPCASAATTRCASGAARCSRRATKETCVRARKVVDHARVAKAEREHQQRDEEEENVEVDLLREHRRRPMTLPQREREEHRGSASRDHPDRAAKAKEGDHG